MPPAGSRSTGPDTGRGCGASGRSPAAPDPHIPMPIFANSPEYDRAPDRPPDPRAAEEPDDPSAPGRHQNIDDHIEFARGKRALNVFTVVLIRGYLDTRRLIADQCRQRRKDRGLDRVAQADPEMPARCLWVEIIQLRKHAGHLAKPGPHRPDQLPGQGRRHDLVSFADEQRIVQQLSQPRERMTDRRLGQVQTLARLRDVAFREYGSRTTKRLRSILPREFMSGRGHARALQIRRTVSGKRPQLHAPSL